MGLELLEIGPWSWNFTGGEFPKQQRQGEGGSGIGEIPTNIWQLPWKWRFPWDLRDASTVGILGASSKGRSQSWIIPRSGWKSLQLEFHRGRIPKAANTGKRGIWELEGTEGDLSLFPPKKKKSQWEQGQLPWKKTTKKEGTSGRSEDFGAFPVPSLPSINPKENPALFFLLYGFVLQEGGEENSNPHSQKFPLWDLFPLGKSLGNSNCAPSPIQLLPQCPTPGNFSQAPSFQFPLVQHTQILL